MVLYKYQKIRLDLLLLLMLFLLLFLWLLFLESRCLDGTGIPSDCHCHRWMDMVRWLPGARAVTTTERSKRSVLPRTLKSLLMLMKMMRI
jgi:hypothetical protein